MPSAMTIIPRFRPIRAALSLAVSLAACGDPPDDAPGPGGPTASADSSATDSFYRLERIAPDVYATVVRDGVSPTQFATSLIVVRATDVLVVDTRQHAPAAEQLLDTIAGITDLPVGIVVNTHWHGDHVQGNEAFRARYPGVRIVAGASTAADMVGLGRERLDGEIARVDERIETGRRWLENGVRDDGTALTEEEKAALPGQLEALAAYADARREVTLVPPDVEVDSALTLDGAPRVDVLSVGPAHTRGDVIVVLPDLGIAAIGDLVEQGFPWLGDGYPAGWAEALDRIAALDLRAMLPGHGPVLRDRTLFEVQRRFARAVAVAARQGVAAGLGPEAAREAADLDRFEAEFTAGLADLTVEERRRRFTAYADETFARAYEEAGGVPPGEPASGS